MDDSSRQTYITLRADVDGIKGRLALLREILDNPSVHEKGKLKVRDSVRFWSRQLGAAEARLNEFMAEQTLNGHSH